MITENKSGNPALEQQIIAAIQEVYDPEIPVNVYDLGLIYEIRISTEKQVHIVMTLTSPNCPEAESLPGKVRLKVMDVPGVMGVNLELTFEPPWDADQMTDDAKLELGML
ncbi:MAG: SUF system Fe-S cluster assembly protein [Bacteroidetes bacterium]|nr:SUF system Fe-S cluster assembly protein [Bacteroidota bacterium]MBU1718468.1 SUF system Fe-S cluster assembly protein [Bacteroidota bacterium]